jgi:hypothetical protein
METVLDGMLRAHRTQRAGTKLVLGTSDAHCHNVPPR